MRSQLGLFDFALPIPTHGPRTNIDVLCDLMRKRMTLQPHERDLMGDAVDLRAFFVPVTDVA